MQQRFMSTAFLCTTAAALFSASAAANPVSVKDGVLQWQNGSEGSPTAGGYREARGRRCEPDLEKCEAERRWNEEGKDPGIGSGA